MLGVGQRTILEHHIVPGRFVLKVGCVTIFIYQNNYYNRIYSHLYHIISKYPILKITLSKQKMKVRQRKKMEKFLSISVIGFYIHGRRKKSWG